MSTPLPKAGTKRPAPNDLDDEQRFTKRFNLLNLIDQPSHLYIPVQPASTPPHHLSPSPAPSPDPGTGTDTMAIDDTPSRIYIHDLAAELSSLPPDSSTESLIFLPDIERRLNRIPSFLLRPDKEEKQGKELVLYHTDPSPGKGEGDIVRRAIEETRRRKREELESGRERQTWERGGEGEIAHGFGGEEWGHGTRADEEDTGIPIGRSGGYAAREEDVEQSRARREGWGEIGDDEESQWKDDDEDPDAMDIE
ncbi:Hypothetical protein D9617_29g006530 [Elsinoe fawcettii]|nr:Hypothetical protein D9617_29g006530 [Elsinoe fawcettii]